MVKKKNTKKKKKPKKTTTVNITKKKQTQTQRANQWLPEGRGKEGEETQGRRLIDTNY